MPWGPISSAPRSLSVAQQTRGAANIDGEPGNGADGGEDPLTAGVPIVLVVPVVVVVPILVVVVLVVVPVLVIVAVLVAVLVGVVRQGDHAGTEVGTLPWRRKCAFRLQVGTGSSADQRQHGRDRQQAAEHGPGHGIGHCRASRFLGIVRGSWVLRAPVLLSGARA